MAKPTQSEITKEIETLREQVKTVRKYSSFGDDNRAKINAQIRVADEDMSDEEIGDAFDGEIQSAAQEMRDWMDYGEDGSPSEGWAPLC
jgi:hypothetical protein